MPKIKINGTEYEVAAGKTVLQAALENGIYIPHYCYHPDLPIAGNCRMCLVDIRPGAPKLSIACNAMVADNMEVFTETEKVAEARRAVMEFLLKNHPIDCPICDQAGECWLQHYYMDYGRNKSRAPEAEKVKKHKAIKAGPTMMLDTERCILCGRCVRFMSEVAKEDCLIIMNRRDRAEIALFPGRELNNPYSMNLADICPVGAWTTADFRFKKRVWFLTSSPSICPACSKGCNLQIDHHRGQVYRFKPRTNPAVNQCWMCDRGRRSYHAINRDRLLRPMAGGRAIGWTEAIDQAASVLAGAEGKLVVAVSASVTVEEGKKVLEVFRDQFKARVVLFTGAPGEGDDFLRRSDLNANRKGLADLGLTETLPDKLEAGRVLGVIETAGGQPPPLGLPAPALVISPTTAAAAGQAKVALPSATFAETAGTFVNADGLAQKFEPAFPPMGESRPLVEILDCLAQTAKLAQSA